jgi:hypothetical protein
MTRVELLVLLFVLILFTAVIIVIVKLTQASTMIDVVRWGVLLLALAAGGIKVPQK